MSMGPVPIPVIDAYWSGQLVQHDSLVTRLDGPCQSQPVLQTTDATGSGTHLSQLTIGEAPGGLVYLSATGAPPGTFEAPRTFYAQTCDGLTTSSTSPNRITEQLAAVSTFLQLMPEAGNPGRYRGRYVVAHQETPRTGGSDYVDWTITWDITRNRR